MYKQPTTGIPQASDDQMAAYRQYMYETTGNEAYNQPFYKETTPAAQPVQPAYTSTPYSISGQASVVQPSTSSPSTFATTQVVYPSAPAESPTQQEAVPAPTGDAADWKGLYDDLSAMLKKNTSTTSNTGAYQYGPTATYAPTSYSYRGTTSYSGKGA
jgi:hypothetical protein